MKEQFETDLKIRMTQEMRDEIDRLATLHQTSAAAIIRQMINKCIREENAPQFNF